MTVSILTVDDEADVAELFRQHFRREVRQGLYVLHFVCSAEEALQMLADGIRPQLIVILSDINIPRHGRPWPVARGQEIVATHAGHDGHRLWRRRASPPRQRIRGHRVPRQAGRFRLSESAAAAVAHHRGLIDPGPIASGRFLRRADPPIRLERGRQWCRVSDAGLRARVQYMRRAGIRNPTPKLSFEFFGADEAMLPDSQSRRDGATNKCVTRLLCLNCSLIAAKASPVRRE